MLYRSTPASPPGAEQRDADAPPAAPAKTSVFDLRCDLCEAIEKCKEIHDGIVGRHPQNKMEYTPKECSDDPIDDDTLNRIRTSVYDTVFRSTSLTKPTMIVWENCVDVRRQEEDSKVCLFRWSYPNGAEWFYPTLPRDTISALVAACSTFRRKLYLHDFAYVLYTLADDGMDASQNSRGNDSILRLPFRLKNFRSQHDSIDQGSYYYEFGFRSTDPQTDRVTQRALCANARFLSAIETVRSLAYVPAVARHSATMQSLLSLSSGFDPTLRLEEADIINKWYRFQGRVTDGAKAAITAGQLCQRSVHPRERVTFRAFLREWKPSHLTVSKTKESEDLIDIITSMDNETFRPLQYDEDEDQQEPSAR